MKLYSKFKMLTIPKVHSMNSSTNKSYYTTLLSAVSRLEHTFHILAHVICVPDIHFSHTQTKI
jgi:hypothetical protein